VAILPVTPTQIPAAFKQAMVAQAQGQMATALDLYRQILMVRPSLAEVHFQIGRIHHAQGDAAKAEAALRKALSLKPAEIAIWRELAGALSGGKRKKLEREAHAAGIVLDPADAGQKIRNMLAAGLLAEAETAAFALVRVDPNGAIPALLLGQARAAQGNWSGALGPLDKAVERAPTDPAAAAALGETLVNLDDWNRAEVQLQTANQLGADVALPLSRLMRLTGRIEAAQDVWRVRAPKSTIEFRELSRVLAGLRKPKAALAATEAAIKVGGPPVELKLELAGLLLSENESGPALQIQDALARTHPKVAGIRTVRGQLRQSLGDLAGGEQDLREAIRLAPNEGYAYRSYFGGKKTQADDPMLVTLAQRLDRTDLAKENTRQMCFAMAKAQEDLGNYADSFAHLVRGNRLIAEAYPYDFEVDLREARALVAAYRAGNLVVTVADQGPAPIFVTGLPRSGTTLVETICSAHSDVVSGGEMPFLRQAMSRVLQSAKRTGQLQPDGLADAATLYDRAARRRSGAKIRYTDKAISVFSIVGYAALAMPNARFLMMRRDPRDVGLSIFKNIFPDGTHRYAYDLAALGRYIRLHDALQSFWAEALPGRVHIVDYDALTGAPEPHIRALIGAAGLEWQDACLTPHKSTGQVNTLSYAQVRQPIYRSSVAAWTRYETELAPLLEALEKPVTL
jgi:tetratricopeptide (TPR) repeat protein